jgi:hypothetical protein
VRDVGQPAAENAAVKCNRFIRLCGGIKTVNRILVARARDLAGRKGYVSNLAARPDGTPLTAEFVIGAYRRLVQIGKSFRMSEHDLQARPVCRHRPGYCRHGPGYCRHRPGY